MRRASRLFQIVQLLQQRRVTRAEFLAEALEVSVRTIYRDMQELMSTGVPIEGEAGVGYTLHRHFRLPPITFDHEQLEALLLGIQMAKSWGDPEIALAAEAAIRKIEAVLPEVLQRQLTNPILFAPDFAVPKAMISHLPSLRRSIRDQTKVQLVYRRRDGDTLSRIVRPLALYFWGYAWTLSAWCETRCGFRNFRLDRISSLGLLQEHFTDEEGKTLEDFRRQLDQEKDDPPWHRRAEQKNDDTDNT